MRFLCLLVFCLLVFCAVDVYVAFGEFLLAVESWDGFVFVAVLFDLVSVDCEVVCMDRKVLLDPPNTETHSRTFPLYRHARLSGTWYSVHVEGPKQGRGHKEACGGRGDTKQRKRIAQKRGIQDSYGFTFTL